MHDKTVTIWHNPRCSKSRATLELIRARGIEPSIVEYLKDPPTPEEIDRVLRMLDMAPRDLMRKNEAPYREARLDNDALGRDELINAISEHPILIQRPVVIRGDRAVLGRPPENVAKLLD